jgi:hypothetical protein
MGLLDAKDLSGFNLGKAASLDDTVDLERQPRFEELLFGMGQSKVGENIPMSSIIRRGPLRSSNLAHLRC